MTFKHAAATAGLTVLLGAMTPMMQAAAAETQPTFTPVVAGPSIPMTLPVAGSIIDILVQSWLTRDQYSMVLIKDAPGGGPIPMIHSRETETFYVLEGHYQFSIGDKIYDKGPGDVVVNPPGVLHGFKVVGDTQGTLLAVYTPGGFENFFLEWARNGYDTLEPIQKLEAKFGIVGNGVAVK